MPKKKGKKKGKGKKNKISKDEKARMELLSAVDVLRNNHMELKAFVKRMEKWLSRHSAYLTEILQSSDCLNQGTVNYEQFKSGLLDLHVPCNNVEIFLLSTLLDEIDSGEVPYTDMTSSLEQIFEKLIDDEEKNFEGPRLALTVREFGHCPQCDIALYEPERRTCFTYVFLDIRFIPLLSIRNHEFHKKFVYPAQSAVQSLLNKLISDLDIASSKLAIFKDYTKSRDSQLAADQTLEDCGYCGGIYTDPVHATFYYDYKTEFLDSPLLLCDNFMEKSSRKSQPPESDNVDLL